MKIVLDTEDLTEIMQERFRYKFMDAKITAMVTEAGVVVNVEPMGGADEKD